MLIRSAANPNMMVTGNPIAIRLSCGATRPSIPRATLVINKATTTGSASKTPEEKGYSGYRILDYSEGIESSTPLTHRFSEGTIQLVKTQVP